MQTFTKGLTALSLLSLAAPAAVAADSKPNILWIVTDDQRADALACYNKAKTGKEESRYGYVSSPELDKLAKEGTLFTNSYCNSPVSASSRSSMHSGLYTYHRGVLVFEYHHIHPDFMTPTMPEYLKELGYNTMGFGKIGVRLREKDPKTGKMVSKNPYETFFNVTDYDKAGLTDWTKKTIWSGENAGTIQYYYGPDGKADTYYSDRKGKELTTQDIADQERVAKKFDHLNRYFADGRVARSTILGGVSSQPSHQTSDGYITQDAQRYLATQDKPFKSLMGTEIDGPKSSQPQLLYMGYHFPHTPVLPSASFRERFKEKSYTLPLFDKEEYEKMPGQMQKWCTTAGTYEMSDKDKESFIRDYYAFCAMGDSLIGETVRSFKDYCKQNKQEYVILIATGDHGWHLGEQGVCAKGQGFLSSTHTAVIVVGSDKKKFPKNKIVDTPIEYVDFLPTFVSAAGGDLTSDKFKHLDGYDLVDVISGKRAPREYTISELGSNVHMRTKDFMFTMQNRRAPKVINAAAIEKEYKRMMNLPLEQLNAGLYDLRVDPLERNNVALDPKYRELAEWFHKKLGTIALGDERIEVDWKEMNSYYKSSFGIGSDNKKFDAPASIIPKVKVK
ncbi:MAG: sulfatase-like hydrolase/transferase [Rikenellaceae bacterium]